MQEWVASVALLVLTKLGSWAIAKALEKIHGAQAEAATDASVDQKLAGFKKAYQEVFDGNKLTPDDKKNLRNSIADFIRSGGPGL